MGARLRWAGVHNNDRSNLWRFNIMMLYKKCFHENDTRNMLLLTSTGCFRKKAPLNVFEYFHFLREILQI